MQVIAKFERIVLKENLVQMVFKVEADDINDGILELAQSAGENVDVDIDGAFTELFKVSKLTLTDEATIIFERGKLTDDQLLSAAGRVGCDVDVRTMTPQMVFGEAV